MALSTIDQSEQLIRRQIYAFKTDTLVELKLSQQLPLAFTKPVFSEDARYIAYAFRDEAAKTILLQVYSSVNGEAITPLLEHGEERPDNLYILQLTALFLDKNQQLISVGRNHVKQWSLSTGKLIDEFPGRLQSGGDDVSLDAFLNKEENVLTQCIYYSREDLCCRVYWLK